MTLRVFLKTLNPWLTIVFAVCILIVLLMDLWLFDIDAPCKFFLAIGRFNYGVALSYIAAYIFYLMTVHYPETKSAISIYTAASFPAKAIVTNIENIILDMANKLGINITRDNITEEIIKDVLQKTKCYASSTVMNTGGVYYNWIEYLHQKNSLIKTFQQQLISIYPKMDGEYIATVEAIGQHDSIAQSINIINVNIALGLNSKSNICFDNGLEDWYVKIYNKAKKLDNIITARNSQYGIRE